MSLPETKLSRVRGFMAADDWRAAVLFAAKFADLGAQRDAILSAREAYLRPEFQRMVKKDPVSLIAAGKAALIERFGNV